MSLGYNEAQHKVVVGRRFAPTKTNLNTQKKVYKMTQGYQKLIVHYKYLVILFVGKHENGEYW